MQRYVLDGNRQVICNDIDKWAAAHKEQQWQVALTRRGLIVVSTQFTGLDLQIPPGRSPMTYETRVYGGAYDGWHQWYDNRGAALDGHAVLCRKAFNYAALFGLLARLRQLKGRLIGQIASHIVVWRGRRK